MNQNDNGWTEARREKLLRQIDEEKDDLQKAHLLRSLSLELYKEANRLQSGSSLDAASHALSEYLNFVEDNVAIKSSRHVELLARVDKSAVRCSLGDANDFFDRFAKKNGLSLSSRAELHDHTQAKCQVATTKSWEPTKIIPEVHTNHLRSMNASAMRAIDESNGVENPKLASKFVQKPVAHNNFVFHTPNQVNSSDSIAPHQSIISVSNVQLPNFHKQNENHRNTADSHRFNSFNVSHAKNPLNEPNTLGHKRKFRDGIEDSPTHSTKYFNQDEPPQSGLNLQPQYGAVAVQPPSAPHDFRTGLEELEIRYNKKFGSFGDGGHQFQQQPPPPSMQPQQPTFPTYGATKKSLGGRRNINSKFVPPIAAVVSTPTTTIMARYDQASSDLPTSDSSLDPLLNDERLKHIDPKMIEMIRSEIMHKQTHIGWDDIAGLDYAKKIIKEAIVWPLLRPDIFTGIRRPPRGILLFGPPGTGKTLIGKCIASQSNSTFFSISASTLTSKYVGEGEKMVRALFAVAGVHQPAVVFIDEIDSLLCQRSESEHESSRRLKTEFLIQLDGAATPDQDRILIVGATNRPQELDEAARRRLVKRLYIPLPEQSARIQILKNLLRTERTDITIEEIERVGTTTEGFSGADMQTLCHEAAMGPIRTITETQMNHVDVADVRPVNYADFQSALDCVRASVSQNDLKHYIEWDCTYGSGAGKTK